jgi:hypothetical protein
VAAAFLLIIAIWAEVSIMARVFDYNPKTSESNRKSSLFTLYLSPAKISHFSDITKLSAFFQMTRPLFSLLLPVICYPDMASLFSHS